MEKDELIDFLITAVHRMIETVALPYTAIFRANAPLGRTLFAYVPPASVAKKSGIPELQMCRNEHGLFQFCEAGFENYLTRMTSAYHVAYATFFPGLPSHDDFSVLFGLAGNLVRSQYRLYVPGPYFSGNDDHPLAPVIQLFLVGGMLPTEVSPENRRRITDSIAVEVRMAHAFLLNSSRGHGMTDEEIKVIISASPSP